MGMMFPYYYPTTAVLIDDDIRFLQSFAELIGHDILVRTFTSAQLGLNYLVGDDADHISRIARLGVYFNTDSWPFAEVDRLQIMLSSYVGQLRGDDGRFDTVSVAIVDLNMPNVDGLMICRALRRRPVRTILLTGNATERLALEAFNQGLIDRFVSKHDPNLPTVIVQHIKDLQNAYFRRVTTTIKEALVLNFLHFMTDGAFLRYFSDLCAARNIVEYYIRALPPGVELIRANGQSFLLLVLSQQELRARISIAKQLGADPELIAGMERGEIVTQFPSEGGYFEPRFNGSWRMYAAPGQFINGKERWLTGLLPSSAIRPKGPSDFVSYDAFLQARDRA
jgi:CheY-like chemotaxis protein